MSSIVDQISARNNKTKGSGKKYQTISWMVLLGLIVATGIIGTSVFSYKWKGVLTEEERKWIQQHPAINFAPDPNFPPIEFFDDKGNYIGLVAEYFTFIERNLGIDIEIVQLDSWNEVLVSAKNRHTDGITAAQITVVSLDYQTSNLIHRLFNSSLLF